MTGVVPMSSVKIKGVDFLNVYEPYRQKKRNLALISIIRPIGSSDEVTLSCEK